MRDRVLGILYSRQRGYRSLSFLLVGLISVGAYAGVVRVPDRSVPGWVLAARREAVDRAVRGQAVIRDARQAQELPINPGDRFGTGLIGMASSPLTTELGEL